MNKIEMCLAVAENLEKKRHSDFISVKKLANFINKNYSLNDVKKMYNEIK